MFNGVFVPLFSRLQTFPFLRHSSEKRPIEMRVLADSLFLLCLEKSVRHCVMRIPGLAVVLLYPGLLLHKV